MSEVYKEYFKNDKINKPDELIWEDIDSYTGEIFADDKKEIRTDSGFSKADVLLPKLEFDGKTVKGILVSRAVDYLYSFLKDLSNDFYVIANSMWGSFPKSEKADAYFMLYENPKRAEWFRKKYPQRADKLLLPFQDADYTSEYSFYPIDLEKDIDVFITARMLDVKNLDIFLQSLIYIDKKYGKKLKVILLTQNKNDINSDNPVYLKLLEISGGEEKLKQYIKFETGAEHSMMLMYYSRAKLTAFTSIFEGKNRSIQESVLCNTPVICFSAYNKYIRGNTSILPEGCVYYVDEFSPEAFGEKMYRLLEFGSINYNTREIALKYFGRANSADKIIKSIPYYQENIPALNDSFILDNEFINNALCCKERGSYQDFLYKQNITIPLNEDNNYFYCKMANYI